MKNQSLKDIQDFDNGRMEHPDAPDFYHQPPWNGDADEEMEFDYDDVIYAEEECKQTGLDDNMLIEPDLEDQEEEDQLYNPNNYDY